MGINYGSSFEEKQLRREEVGYDPLPKKDKNVLTTFFRTLITMIMIGVAFVPGIGAGTELAVSLTGGAINEALDFVNGTTSLQGTIINFSAPLAGYFTTTKINAKLIDEVVGSAKGYEKLTASFSKAGLRQEEVAEQLIRQGIITDISQLHNLDTVAKIIRSTNITKASAKSKGLRLIQNQTSTLKKKEITETLSILRRNAKIINSNATAYEDSVKAQIEIMKAIGFTSEEYQPLIRQINSLNLNPQQKFSTALGFIRDSNVIVNNPNRFNALKEALQTGKIALNEAYEIALARQLKQLAEKAFPQPVNIVRTRVKKEAQSNIRRFFNVLRKPSTREFNDKVVQPTQAIFDANDLARAPIEAAYRKLKISIDKAFAKSKSFANKVKDVEDFFTKTGGIAVDSGWQIGYRKITNNLGVPNLVQISYGKDTGKIRQVYVYATDIQLHRYTLSPGNYYLKHFAFSRGGAKLNLDGFFSFAGLRPKAISRQAISALSFIPAAGLRNIFSIVSNVVENVFDMSTGAYQEEYWDKFKKSFQNNILNRTARLLTRKVGGNTASIFVGKEIGNMVGRELQRISTNILVPIISTKITNIGRAARGLKPLKPFTKQSILNKGLIGIKSNLRRQLRHVRGSSSVALQTLAADRKLKILGRAPNTFTPGRKYRGVRFKK